MKRRWAPSAVLVAFLTASALTSPTGRETWANEASNRLGGATSGDQTNVDEDTWSELDAELHQAAQYASPEMVALLIERGAEADARDDIGWTPLHHALLVGPHRYAVSGTPNGEHAP